MSVITISRQFGAGGQTVGKSVAEKLGYTLVDENIIERVAMEANVSPNWVKSIENEAGGALLRYISGLRPFGKSYVERITEDKKGFIDGHIYVNLLYKVIPQIADEDDCIILGRGGQYILKNRENTVHLLLVADFEDRVRFMEKNYDLSKRQATALVNRQGKRRLSLYRYFGREDYDQPYLYHLVLNLSKLPIEKAADQICKLIQG